MTPTTPPADRPLRADARQNVEQILDVAQQVFADLGYQASIAEVAKRSGLGMGTIYRHIPNKAVLVERIAIKVMGESLAQVRRALAEEPVTWTAFSRVVRHMTRLRSSPPRHTSDTAEDEPVSDLADRYTGVLLDGLRAPGSEPLSQPAPGRREIDQFFRATHGL